MPVTRTLFLVTISKLIGTDTFPCVVLSSKIYVQKSFFISFFFFLNLGYGDQRRLFSGNLAGMFLAVSGIFAWNFWCFICSCSVYLVWMIARCRGHQDCIRKSFMPVIRTIFKAPLTSPLATIDCDLMAKYLVTLMSPCNERLLLHNPEGIEIVRVRAATNNLSLQNRAEIFRLFSIA